MFVNHTEGNNSHEQRMKEGGKKTKNVLRKCVHLLSIKKCNMWEERKMKCAASLPVFIKFSGMAAEAFLVLTLFRFFIHIYFT